jgi:hypothetical protein
LETTQAALEKAEAALEAKLKANGNSSYMANRWTPQEDALLRRMGEASTRIEVIAAKLNRSVRAIKARS